MTQKIKILFFKSLLLSLFCSGLILFLCSCTKKDTVIATIIVPINSNNTDTMPISGSKKYLALGDSYTIGTSVTEADRYPVQTTAILKAQGVNISADIIATNGWTTADLLNATKDKPAANDYDAVTILIGVNNQYQGRTIDEYQQQFTTLLQRAIALAANKPGHVIVLSIPDYSVTPFASGSNKQKIAAEIDAFNAANKMIADNYKVQYLDVTEDSRAAAADLSLVASDGLHFSGKEYAVWSLKLAPMIKAVLH